MRYTEVKIELTKQRRHSGTAVDGLKRTAFTASYKVLAVSYFRSFTRRTSPAFQSLYRLVLQWLSAVTGYFMTES